MHRTLTTVGQCLAGILSLTVVLSASGCKDTGSISEGPQVRLSALSLSEPGLQPAFSSTTTHYTLSVASTVGSVTVTATPENNSTSIKIGNPETAARSLSVDLNPAGSNTDITITLTEQSGSQSAYVITVIRPLPLSSNNDLSNLTVSVGTLTPTPVFSPSAPTYTVDVATGVSSLTVTATVQDSNASLMINGQGISSGQPREISPLEPPGSDTLITILVRAPSGAEKTYKVTVKRPLPSSDAALSALTVSAGNLGFAAGTPTYSVNVPASVDSLTATATKSDPNAVMSASGSVIAPAGVATGSVSSPLGLGTTTTITITVIAQDAVSKRDYKINVFRELR
jgi:hypothetical protein